MRRGFTLLETLVAAGVTLLLGAAALQLLIAGARVYAQGQAHAELQSSGLAALGRLTRELRESAEATVTVWTGTGRADSALAFRDPVPSGASLVNYAPGNWTLVFRDTTQASLITRTDTASGTDPNHLPPGRLGTMVLTPGAGETVLAHNVDAFNVTADAYTVQLDLALGKDLNTTFRIHERVTVNVSLRNRL